MPKNIYTNSPNSIAVTRIQFDIRQINEAAEVLDKENIYFKFYEGDTVDTTYHQLLIGPADSPYHGGFYLFKAQFPDIYPFQPMTMKSLTQGGDVRKHPNLYKCGKCCFSFLGTWSGPPWTACNNSRSVAFSMRSVMTKYPLENEPGYENIKSKQEYHNTYAQLVGYFNLKYGVCNIIEKIDSEPYSYFKSEILKYFIENIDLYYSQLDKYKNLEGKKEKCGVYGFTIVYDVNDLIQRFDKLKTKYT